MTVKKSFRELLVGETVVAVETDSEGLGIAFTDDWSLSVWNDILLTHFGEALDVGHASDLVGQQVESFKAGPDQETLIFSSGFVLVVALSKRTPDQVEVMMLRGPEQLIVVWNE